MSDHITRDVTVLRSGARANMTVDRLALLDTGAIAWRSFAQSLEGDLAGFQSSPLNYTVPFRTFFRAVRDKLLDVESNGGIEAVLGEMLDHATELVGSTEGIRTLTGIRYFLAQARWSGLVLLPLGTLRGTLVPWHGPSAALRPSNDPFLLGLHSAVARMAADAGVGVTDIEVMLKNLGTLFLCADFDLTKPLDDTFFEAFWLFLEANIRPTYRSGKKSSTNYSRMLQTFNKTFEFTHHHMLLKGFEGGAPNSNSQYWRRKRQPEGSASSSFAWWTEGRPDLEQWGKWFSWYVNSTARKAPKYTVNCLKRFCLFLGNQDVVPCTPVMMTRAHFQRRDNSPKQTFYEYLEANGAMDMTIGYQTVLTVKAFFDRWMDEFCPGIANWNNPITDADMDGTWNKGSNATKTNKEILPVRLIKLMKEIIVEHDFAWPRTIGDDYVRRPSADRDGGYEKVWCPARALGLLFMLIVPVRTIQTRLLDSGEGDDFVSDPVSGKWTKNLSKLAERGRQMGLLQQIYDSATETNFLGLRITTNKTAVLTAADFEKHYDIPWQCDELIPHLRALQQWQATYNPTTVKLTRGDLSDTSLHPSKAIRNLPGYHFLFRDPCNNEAQPNEPVSHNRFRGFFLKLLAEAQRRLVALGEDVVLVTRNDHQNLVSRYSLHGLRASGITHFLEAGVPLQVVCEFLAGHATIMMTAHYAKIGAALLTRTIDQAFEAYENGTHDEFIAQLQRATRESLSGIVAANSEDGITALADTSPGLWSIAMDGICPTGRALCHIGGQKMSTHANAYYAPVPGGPRNCARCRFFITGPAFLNGQVVAYNGLMFAMSEKAKDLERVKAKVAAEAAKGKNGRRLERHRTNIDALELELAEMVWTMQAKQVLIGKSRARLRSAAEGGKHSLISLSNHDEITLLLEETSEWDLLEFVAQACELFPEKAEPSAPLRKGKLMDQLLKRNGYEPLFYALADDEALAAGNLLTRFLQARVGRDRTRALVHGTSTLRSLGIDREFEVAARSMVGPVTLLVKGPDGAVFPEESTISKAVLLDRQMAGEYGDSVRVAN